MGGVLGFEVDDMFKSVAESVSNPLVSFLHLKINGRSLPVPHVVDVGRVGVDVLLHGLRALI